MNRNIRLLTNEDFEIAVRWKDDDGTPYTLLSGAMQVRATEEATDILLTATVVIEAGNWASATIPRADIAALTNPPGQAEYDFVVVRDDGRQKVMLEGTALIGTGVTR